MESTLTTLRPTSAAAVPVPAEVARPAGPRRAMGRVAAGLVAVLLSALTPGLVFAWDASSYSSADEQELVTLTNQSRAAAGLPALKVDSDLTSMARWRSKDMVVRDYFSHSIPPDGKKVFDYLKADGYCYKAAGENIGINNFPDDIATETIHQGFMDSPTHRANILGTWTNIGIGAYKGTDGRHVWTVLFSTKCSSSPSPTPTPTPKPTPTPTPKPTATPTPTATPPGSTPTPTPTRTPGPTPTPATSPGPTPTPGVSPSPGVTPSPEPTTTPGPTSTTALDPAELVGSLGSGLRFAGLDVGGGRPTGPGASPEPGVPAPIGLGLQVIDPTDPSGLVEAIVGDVAGGYFGG